MFQGAESSASHHQGISDLIALEALPKKQHRNITTPVHRERLRLIGSDALALHKQELALLALGVRDQHRGAVVGLADHGGL